MTSALDEDDVPDPTPSTSAAIQMTPLLPKSYFDNDLCRAPSKRDPRLKAKHPIELCRSLTPIPTVTCTPMSPPDNERGETASLTTLQISSEKNPESVVKSHLQKAYVHGELNPGKYSDCVVCGLPLEEIKRRTITEYIISTSYAGETERQMQSRIDAFVAGMNSGTFLFLPTGVSQAAACDGNTYTISTAERRSLPGTVPIN